MQMKAKSSRMKRTLQLSFELYSVQQVDDKGSLSPNDWKLNLHIQNFTGHTGVEPGAHMGDGRH